MSTLQNILFYCIANAMKVGNVIAIIIFLFATKSFSELIPERSWFYTFLVLCITVMIGKFILGGWSASSIKGMIWSCIMSTIGGIGLVLLGMSVSGEFSFWICTIPVILGAVLGIWAYNWVEDIIVEQQAENFSVESVVDSIFDNGLKGTFNIFSDSVMGITFWAYGRGVAVYSNVCVLTGLLILLIYK